MERMTIDKIRSLPPELQQQILTFAEFVEFRAKSQMEIDSQEPISPVESSANDLKTTGKRQGFGSWRGTITIHPDFDEPLSDFEEYM